MLDIVAAIVLTALSVTTVGILLLASPVEPRTGRRLAVGAGAWLAAVVVLAAAGFFADASRLGTAAIGLAVLAPVLLVAASASRASLGRRLALGIPLAVLIAVHAGRLLGAFFLVLHADGRLPRTFATSAGWGDIAIATLALPLAWMVYRRRPGWRALALGWNAIGFLDLVTAVTLGVGSRPGSPLQFLFEAPGSTLMGTLPWLLIPGFLVPVYLLTHLAVFAQLAASTARGRWRTERTWAARTVGR
jgi:hypothetical protein